MVRPQFGPSRFKPRPRSDGYNDEAPEDHNSPHSRSQRGFRGHRGKAPTSWRDNRVIGRPHLSKRPPLMGERREGVRREQQSNQWRSPNQDHFSTYPPQNETHRGHRRPSPSRPNHPPPPQRRPSPHSPAHTSPSQRGPPVGHGHHSAHRSPSPRHYHGQPPDRRPAPTPPPPTRGSFRGFPRRPGPSREEERNWSPRRPHNLRESGAPARGGKRWIERGGFPHRGARGGPSGFVQRKPREFHGRAPYPERWSAERDSRKQQHGEEGREREASGHRGGGMWSQEGGSPHHPPYRSPSWKGGPSQPSSFYPNNPQKRPDGPPPPQKRSFQEPPAGPGPEQRNHFKHPLRDAPPFHSNSARGFGGRPLSLKDKSRILKGRKMRAESVMRLRAPPPPRPSRAEIKTAPPKPPLQEDSPHRATLAMRKERFQANADPLRRRPNKPASPPASPDGNESKSSKESESAEEQVESHRALREHSSSPIEQLPRDLVVVSQWQAPTPHTSSDDRSSSRERTSKTRTERYFNTDGHLMLNERFSKMHDSADSPKDQRGRYTDPKNQRQADVPEENNRPVRPFRKPAPPQRPGFRPGPRRTFPEPAGPFRKPLMGSFVPRPFPSQKPGFRRNQPPYQRGSNHQRW